MINLSDAELMALARSRSEAKMYALSEVLQMKDLCSQRLENINAIYCREDIAKNINRKIQDLYIEISKEAPVINEICSRAKFSGTPHSIEDLI